jgi:hypothetical protein
MQSDRVIAAIRPREGSLSRAILSGFIASVAMALAFALAYGTASLLANVALADRPYTPTLRAWFHGLTNNVLIDLARPNLYAALAVYFTGGLVWAVVYAYVFQPRMAGPDWERGLIFSLVPWVLSLVAFLPLVGGGLLGLGLGAGPFPIVGNFILHAVYGVVLAEVYGPFGDVIVEGELGAPEGDDLWAMPQSESGAAKGLVGGLALGSAVGLTAAILPQVTGGASVLGMNPFAFLLGTALFGAAFGALLGSFAGLSAPAPHH